MRWAYIREIWDFGSTMEIEEKHTGRYGARGQEREEKKKATPEEIAKQNQWRRERDVRRLIKCLFWEREEKKKATPEEIAKQNQWRRERDVRRLIKWNFSSGDYWMTLTYKKGERPAWEQMKKDLAKLIRKVRLKYKKKGWELKYIYRLAIGKKGGPHVHLLVNREADQETGTDRIISELWENGHVYFASLYDAGGYVKLSEYITKPLEEHEPDEIKRYSCSRNLIRKNLSKEIKRRKSGGPAQTANLPESSERILRGSGVCENGD